MRGEGRVWCPPGTSVYHMGICVDGRVIRESTGKTDYQEAVKEKDRRLHDLRRGDSVPHEDRLTLTDLKTLISESYDLRGNRSKSTMLSTWKHLDAFFGERCKVTRIGPRTERYVAARKAGGAPVGSIRTELAFLDRSLTLAVQKKRLSHRVRPYIEKPPLDPTAVRRGFFRRGTVEKLCGHLPDYVAAVVLFLFFCPWRVGAARRLEWRDYSATDGSLTLRPELNKTGHELQIPVDAKHTPELMRIIKRQLGRRRPDCPYIFHGRECGTVRLDKKGPRKPCLGDFQKAWDTGCDAIGMTGRIPHDLRRSGVKHYIDAGNDPHVVMQWSGHRTMSMLQRYHIIDLEDLRRAGKKASAYRGPKEVVVPITPEKTAPESFDTVLAQSGS
jgi:integrase